MSECVVRSWTDQPAFLEEGKNLLRTGEVQVIKVEDDYFVTKGSLFGSQTIKAKDADDAFKAVNLFNRASGERPLDIGKHGWDFV